MAREFFQRLELDSLLLVPTKRPTHKSAPHLADAQHRLAMCRLAVEPFGYAVSDIEVNRESASYTVLTLQEIGRQYPGWELFFLMGEDMFWTVERWKEPEKIFRLAQLCGKRTGWNVFPPMRRNCAEKGPGCGSSRSRIFRFPPPTCARLWKMMADWKDWFPRRWKAISGSIRFTTSERGCRHE